MVVRRAVAGDADALGALASASFVAKFGHLYAAADCAAYVEDGYGAAAMGRLLGEPSVSTWVVEEGGGLLAYAVMGGCKLPHAEVTSRCVELRRLYVVPGGEGRGLGGRLMREVALPAFEAAEALGGRCWLGVYFGNEGAIRFYGRYGFVLVGEYLLPVGSTLDLELILRR